MRQWLLPFAMFAVGCAHQQKPVAQVAQPTKTAEAPPSCANDESCDSKEICLESRCVPISAHVDACQSSVHFNYRSMSMAQPEESQLARAVRCLKSDEALRVTVEGNSDDRGSDRSNRRLAEKRAASVKRFLQTLGVSSGQVRAVSHGESRPTCNDKAEDCRSRNRRVDIRFASKG